MKHFYLTSIFSLLLFFGNQAQNVSRLEAKLSILKGTERITILNQLSEALLADDPKKALDYAEEAIDLSKDAPNEASLMESAFNACEAAKALGKYRKAVNYAEDAIELAKVLEDEQLQLRGLSLLLNIYHLNKQRRKAAKTELELEKLKDKIAIAQSEVQINSLKQRYALSEKENQKISMEKAQIQKNLQQAREAKLEEEARLAKLAQEKAIIDLEIAQLEKHAAERTLQITQQENQLLTISEELNREKGIRNLVLLALISLLVITGFVLQNNTLRRKRLAEKAKAQQQLLEQEKMASLGQLTAGIAHEIKNPLNFINNFAEGSMELVDELVEIIPQIATKPEEPLVKASIEVSQEIKQNATTIFQHGKRIEGIIHTMMDHARGTKGIMVPTDINQLIEKNINLAYHGYRGMNPDFNAAIETNYDDQLPRIAVIPQEISRVLLNIIGNACHALHQKQKADIPDYISNLKVATYQENGHIVISILDNGPGIPKDIQKQVFNPFFTTKPTGTGHTGLGLSISRDIITQRHKGQISVKSEPNMFTEFLISLPMTQQ